MRQVRLNGTVLNVPDPGDDGYDDPKPMAAAPAAAGTVYFKVSAKGGVSVYGLQRWPVTLYAGQWEKLLALGGDIRNFIAANESSLSRK